MKPVFFLGLLIALLPAYLWRFQIFGLPTTFLEILIAVFLIFTLFEALSQKKQAIDKLRRLSQINWAIGLFVLAAIVSTIISPEPIRALGQLKAFVLEPVLIFYAGILTIKKSDLNFLFTCLFVSASVLSFLGILQYFTHVGLPLRFWGNGEEPKRIVSVFEYPNALALYLAPVFGFILVLWQKRFEFIKPAYLYPGLAFMALALGLTFSRGAWLAVTVAVLFLVLRSQGIKKIAVLALILIVLGLTPAVRQRLMLTDASTNAHRELTAAAITKIKASPLLGNGLAGFRTTLAEQKFTGEILNYPHNIILNFWLELGLVGLLAFGWIYYLARNKYKKRPDAINLAVAAYLLVMLLHGLVDAPYFKNDLAVLFWFMISLLQVND